MNAKKIILMACLALYFSLGHASYTLKQQISIPAAGYAVMEHLPSGSIQLSYNCWSTNNSPFTVFVTSQQDFEFWKSNPQGTLTYYVAPSKANFNTQQKLDSFGMVDFSELAVLFFTNNVLVSADVQVELTIQTALGPFFSAPLCITTLIVAASVLICGLALLGKCIKRSKLRNQYAPIEHSDVVIVSNQGVINTV
eukprot:TRINITY_DN4114_c0_g2_i1.p1 TRINITY_DN4114_c0_g2~~TRINITY_DN4114_c0_g2_i1.p1  ORF type:complete len:205 (-),score=8.67 TRINITY_DN4114_c0_g2_i1:16-603(-)